MRPGPIMQKRCELFTHCVNRAANDAFYFRGGLQDFYWLAREAIAQVLPPAYLAAFTRQVAAQLWARFPDEGCCTNPERLYHHLTQMVD